MSMQSTTRSGGNTPGLPSATLRPEVLSRRNALGAAAAVALSLAALGTSTLDAQAASIAIVAPASPDAALITRADRLAALARRCDAVDGHRADLEDRVFDLSPRPGPPPQPPLHESITETPTATGRILHIRQEKELDPIWVQWENATAAAKAAHERQESDTAASLGLPEVLRRSERMARRRDRWATDLAAMKPSTSAGLGAKAGALLALLGDDESARFGGLDQHADLVLSVLADVVRLGAGGRA